MSSTIRNTNVFTQNAPSYEELLKFFQRGVNENAKNQAPKKLSEGEANLKVALYGEDASDEPSTGSGVFKDCGLNADDVKKLNAIYSGAVLPDGSHEAGRGYMGIAAKGGNLVPVKFLTHAKERYFGFKTDYQLMKEIYQNANGQSAFDASDNLRVLLLQLANKVNRADVVAGIISKYEKRAQYENRSLLSRQTVFDALMEIKAGQDKFRKVFSFKFYPETAGTTTANESTSVCRGNRTWNQATIDDAQRPEWSVGHYSADQVKRNKLSKELMTQFPDLLKRLAKTFADHDFIDWDNKVKSTQRRIEDYPDYDRQTSDQLSAAKKSMNDAKTRNEKNEAEKTVQTLTWRRAYAKEKYKFAQEFQKNKKMLRPTEMTVKRLVDILVDMKMALDRQGAAACTNFSRQKLGQSLNSNWSGIRGPGNFGYLTNSDILNPLVGWFSRFNH